MSNFIFPLLLLLFIVGIRAEEIKFSQNSKNYVLLTEHLDWPEAYHRCRSFNQGRLTRIQSSAEEEGLRINLLPYRKMCVSKGHKEPQFWTSGERLSTTKYIWNIVHSLGDTLESNKLKYTHWFRTEPNFGIGKFTEYCMNISFYGDKIWWTDNNCDTQRCSICEVDPGVETKET